MFTIYAGDRLLWSEMSTEPQYALIDPVVKTEINKTGSLEFTILDSHVLYNEMIPFAVDFVVYEDDKVFFEGRLIDTSTSFYNERKVVAEGIMGYLNDTYVAPRKATETPEEHFRQLIQEHNSQCEPKKRFEIGEVTVTDSLGRVDFKSEGYRNTKSAIDSDLVEPYKAFIRVRRVGDKHYIDLLKELQGEGSQEVRFAYNLLDMTDEDNAEDVFSVIVPVGKNNLTVASVNDNSKEIKIDHLFERYGRLVKIVQFADATNATTLMTKARDWIEQNVTNRRMRSFSVTALDMARLGYENESFEVGKKYRIISDPNGIEETVYLTAIELHLAELDETTYEFGDPDPNGDSRGGISSAAASITQTITMSNDYLRERIFVDERNLTMVGQKLGIDFDDITVDGGEVHFSGITLLEAVFGAFDITAEDAEGVEGQFEEFKSKVDANSDHLQTFYEELKKTALDPKLTTWDGLIEYFTSTVKQTATGLSTEVQKTDTYINGNEREMQTFRTFMEQTPKDWTVYVQRGEDISSLISLSGSGVTIQGGTITINGEALMSSLAVDGTVYFGDNVWSDGNIDAEGHIQGGPILSTSYFSGFEVYIGGYDEENPRNSLALSTHAHVITASDDGKVTIGMPTNEESSAFFNIADTNFYKNGVSAAEQNEWNSISAEIASFAHAWSNVYHKYSVGGIIRIRDGERSPKLVRFDLNDFLASEMYEYAFAKGVESASQDPSTRVTIDGIGVTDISYDAENLTYALTLNAMASNGETKTDTYGLDVSSVYNSVTFSFLGRRKNDERLDNNRYRVYPTVELTNGRVRDWDQFTVDASDSYKDGRDSVTLSAPSGWENGKVIVKASNGKTYDVTLPSFSVSGGTTFNADHITKVFFTTPSVQGPVKEATVDASSVWTEGYNKGKSEGGTGGNASNISLSGFSWVPAAAGSSAISGRTQLSTISSLISANKNSNGYILLQASISGGTGVKYYYIPMGSV